MVIASRRRSPPWALAPLGGVGRGVLAGIGALVLIEAATNRPGLGRLLIQTIIQGGFVSIGPIVAALLVIGFVGSLLSLAGDGGPVRASGRVPMERWPLAMVAGLGLPVLLLVVSFAVAPGGTPRFDIASTMAPATLLRAGAGVFLLSAGAAFVVGTGVDAMGMGTPPPNPSLARSTAARPGAGCSARSSASQDAGAWTALRAAVHHP